MGHFSSFNCEMNCPVGFPVVPGKSSNKESLFKSWKNFQVSHTGNIPSIGVRRASFPVTTRNRPEVFSKCTGGFSQCTGVFSQWTGVYSKCTGVFSKCFSFFHSVNFDCSINLFSSKPIKKLQGQCHKKNVSPLIIFMWNWFLKL